MIGITGVFCDLCGKRVLDGPEVHQDCIDREQAQAEQSAILPHPSDSGFEKVDWVEDLIVEMENERKYHDLELPNNPSRQ